MPYDVIADLPNIFTNQQLIDAAAAASDSLGLEKWVLLARNGLDVKVLARAREKLYSGPTLITLPDLAPGERALLKAMLIGQLRYTKSGRGKILDISPLVYLRAGANENMASIETLAGSTVVDVLFEEDQWLYVATQHGPAGYVLRKDVEYLEEPPEFVPLTRLQLDEIVLEPDVLMVLDDSAGPGSQRLAKIWNNYGRLLEMLANRLQIEPATAIAVLAVESGGAGYGPDGRLKIRFENHLFYSAWGKQNQSKFHRHFTYRKGEAWLDHTWRQATKEPYQPFHGNQELEWKVLHFASQLDSKAALRSISMGAPQILGRNFKRAGYTSVHEMFDAYQTEIRYQIMSLFNFIIADRNMIEALRRQDFYRFASGYNGSGQAQFYADLIQKWVEAYTILSDVPTGISFNTRGKSTLPRVLETALSFEVAPQLAQVFDNI